MWKHATVFKCAVCIWIIIQFYIGIKFSEPVFALSKVYCFELLVKNAGLVISSVEN